MTNKPYGKAVRTRLRRMGQLAAQVTDARSLALVAISIVERRLSQPEPAPKRTLGDWARAKCVGYLAKAWCWSIERNMWNAGTRLDEKVPQKLWSAMMTNGGALCRKAAA